MSGTQTEHAWGKLSISEGVGVDRIVSSKPLPEFTEQDQGHAEMFATFLMDVQALITAADHWSIRYLSGEKYLWVHDGVREFLITDIVISTAPWMICAPFTDTIEELIIRGPGRSVDSFRWLMPVDKATED